MLSALQSFYHKTIHDFIKLISHSTLYALRGLCEKVGIILVAVLFEDAIRSSLSRLAKFCPPNMGSYEAMLGSTGLTIKDFAREWAVDPTIGDIVVYPFAYYGLLPARKLLYDTETGAYLVESSGEFLMWYESAGYIDELPYESLTRICGEASDFLHCSPLVSDNTRSVGRQTQYTITSIPKGWELCQKVIPLPFTEHGLPAAKAIFEHQKHADILLCECDRRFFFCDDVIASAGEITEARNIKDLILLLPHLELMTGVPFPLQDTVSERQHKAHEANTERVWLEYDIAPNASSE